MRDEIKGLVEPVFAYAIGLKERLDRGETPTLEAEQTVLARLLRSDAEAKRWPDYAGDGDAPESHAAQRGDGHFLGSRYALVCWLDELFVLHSRWKAEWNERKLESQLYGTNDRAWRFWEQVRLAQDRGEADALEVCFLCVALGFRGELRDRRDELRGWLKKAKARLCRVRPQVWPYSLDAEPPTDVPPLPGRRRFQRMLAVAAVAFLVAVPAAAFFLVYTFRQ